MSTALSLPTLPASVTGPSHIPDLTESADIQTALKYLYYGTGGTLNSANGIYGALAGLKTYIDASISGVNVHENVKAATLAGTPIPGVYAAGTADQSGGTGIGAKITYSATGVVTIDGVTLALNDRILVKDGTTALSGINSIANGIYYVSTLGAVGVACVLTRTTDGDNSIQGETAEGDFVFVSGGTTPNNNTSWVLTSSSPTGTGPAGAIRIGTDPITYVQFGSITWGSQTANTFFAAPNGSAGTPTFRGIDYRDLSTTNTPTISGQIPYYAPTGNGVVWSAGPALYVSGGTMTGQLNLAAGNGTTIAPLDFNTGGTLLATPTLGAMEADVNAIYYTDNPGSTSTGAGRGTLLPKQMVTLLANSATTNGSTIAVFDTGNDVLSVLEPAKLYRFRAKYLSTFVMSAATGQTLNIAFAFSNAPVATKYTFKTYTQTPSAATVWQGLISTNASTAVTPTTSSNQTWVTEIEGYFITHATLTSTLTPQFALSPGGAPNVGMNAGCFFEIEKIGTSTQTRIAGNWA